jgi:hypothetical protein
MIRLDNPFSVPPFTERQEVKMRNTDVSGYPMRALILLLVAGIAVAPVLGEEQQERDLSIFWTGDDSHPLDLDSLMDERDKLIENYQKGADCTGKVIGSGDPVIPDSAKIVAYGFSFDKDGIPHEMIAVSQENTDVSQLLVKANQWYNDIIVSTSDGAVKVSSEGWPLIGSGQYYYAAEPYGLVEHNFETYWNSYEMDSTKDYFAIKQIWAMDPGFHRYREQGSKWLNEQGLSYIDWSVSSLGNPALHDRDPLGTATGPMTVSVSLNPTPAISWSFLLNSVTISDESDPAMKRAQWDYTFSGSDAKNTVQGWRPGSTVCVDAPTSGGQYDLAYLYTEGKFIEPTTWPFYQYYYIDTYWNTWVTY